MRGKDSAAFAPVQKKGVWTIVTLDQLPAGQSAEIESVGGQGELRCRLLDMGLIPGTKVSVVKIAPMGDPMELMLRGYSLTIRKEDASRITLKEENV